MVQNKENGHITCDVSEASIHVSLRSVLAFADDDVADCGLHTSPTTPNMVKRFYDVAVLRAKRLSLYDCHRASVFRM